MAKSTASLRVFGDDLDPSEITRLLGSAPSDCYRKGDLVSPKRATTRQYGMWSLSASNAEPDDFRLQVGTLLSSVTQDLCVWHSLGQRFQVDLFCGFFMDTGNQGFTLSVETITALAARGIEPGFDIYSPSPEDEEKYLASREEGATGAPSGET